MVPSYHRPTVAAGAVLLALPFAGCGAQGKRDSTALTSGQTAVAAVTTTQLHDERTVVRIGGDRITAGALAHWLKVMAPHHVALEPPDFAACVLNRRTVAPRANASDAQEACSDLYSATKARALSFLIGSYWLIDEAAKEGMRVRADEIGERLRERERSFPNGKGEFDESLQAIAHTVADVELEIAAELASEAIRRRLQEREPGVSDAAVAAYYRAHMGRYYIPELRDFDIAENFPSASYARKVIREVKAGRSLASTSLHESLPRKSFSFYNGEKRAIYEEIFKIKPHTLSQPIELNGLYFLIEVTRVTPPRVESLAQVRRTIARKLRIERQRHTLAAFIASWRRTWTAQTSCSRGYVLQKCRQYRGDRAPEDPLQLN
jgi:hypothetical protein